jgi:hypothetical protein
MKLCVERALLTRRENRMCDFCGKIVEPYRNNAHKLYPVPFGRICGRCKCLYMMYRRFPPNYNITGKEVTCPYCNKIQLTNAQTGSRCCSACHRNFIFDKKVFNEIARQRKIKYKKKEDSL